MKRLRLPRLAARGFWHLVADLQLLALWGYGLWKAPVWTLAISAVLIRVSLALEERGK